METPYDIWLLKVSAKVDMLYVLRLALHRVIAVEPLVRLVLGDNLRVPPYGVLLWLWYFQSVFMTGSK